MLPKDNSKTRTCWASNCYWWATVLSEKHEEGDWNQTEKKRQEEEFLGKTRGRKKRSPQGTPSLEMNSQVFDIDNYPQLWTDRLKWLFPLLTFSLIVVMRSAAGHRRAIDETEWHSPRWMITSHRWLVKTRTDFTPPFSLWRWNQEPDWQIVSLN